MQGIPYLFIEGEVRYPDTYRDMIMQQNRPMLARKIDAGWEEVAPVELRFSSRASKHHPFVIHKRNYLGKESTYAVDYFRHSRKNVNVASINNHITAEYVAVTAAKRGMAVAMNPDVSANFAFCPFKMISMPDRGEFSIQANPFGTYHGDQVQAPTNTNRLGYEAVLLSGPQFHSAGPTYNGYHQEFELMVSFFSGDAIPEGVEQDLIAFARGPMTLNPYQVKTPAKESYSLLPPAGFMVLPYQNGMLFHWENAIAPVLEYCIRYRAFSGLEEKQVMTSGCTLFLHASDLQGSNTIYLASIETILPEGRISKRSPEIQFRSTQEADHTLSIPNDFKAKLLWANISAWVWRNLLI
jgi:hypothetical protein